MSHSADAGSRAIADDVLALPPQPPRRRLIDQLMTQESAKTPGLAGYSLEVLTYVSLLVQAAQQPMLVFSVDGRFVHSNPAFRTLARLTCVDADVAGDPVAVGQLMPEAMPAAALSLAASNGEWQGEIFLRCPGQQSLVLQLQIVSLRDAGGTITCYGAIYRDTSDEYERGCELQSRNAELQLANTKLRGAQEQMVQTEKMASIGQLAAGVAHEINNPIGYVHSNLATLATYSRHLLTLIETYDDALHAAGDHARLAGLGEMRERFDIEFVRNDLPQLISESREGVERVRKIVQDLKDFSRSDPGDAWTLVDIHRGLESTLNIVWNDLKYKAQIVKTYGDLPPIECVPSELNQVFLNILVNAGQAIEQRGVVTVSTSFDGHEVRIAIGDDGAGIPEHVLPRIFDPFFTTKAVGDGTGLGLSISYGIIKKHGGHIDVTSTPGQGTLFCIRLPMRRTPDTA